MLKNFHRELHFFLGSLRYLDFINKSVCFKKVENLANTRNSGLRVDFRMLSTVSTKKEPEKLKPVTVACIQLCCTEDKDKNFETARSLILQAKKKNAKMIFLPEAFDFIGRSKEESAQLSDTMGGPLITSYQKLAKEQEVWLSLGGFHERQDELRDGKIPWMTNNHVLIDSTGEIKSVYQKVHLFDVVIPEDNVVLKESSFIRGGKKMIKPEKTPVGNLGLGICYDLRFPEFALSLRMMGADVITYPSAFTVPTGQAHWEALLRARAIETQCFVIAAAQTGHHNEKRSSYGHSLIIDPWGKVLADAKKEVGVITADLDLNQIASVRKKMPVLNHRKPIVYGNTAVSDIFAIPGPKKNSDTFNFGNMTLKMGMVFHESQYSRAFVNRKCVVPGHVLVSSKRVVKRLIELSPVELSDIFGLAQKVQIVMQGIHGASSSTITVQDGKDAGQTVEHVHIHILPRKPNDFKENDEIYERLNDHDKGQNIQWRDESDMIIECQQIRDYIMRNHVDPKVGLLHL
ncbi:unnamed protein product [Orchesella dallaii]|uniref:Bis(5'-adenosyl)-triphosphatase n=1 Tax=Orchesella dallaii TaxID=48710 RepID=A0ABP1QS87_9HEXA